MASDILQATLQLALAAAPWLLAGLAAAGLVRALLPQERLQAWLGGSSVGATTRGAVAGAPLPLCSCGAIPAALALHRGGAGRGPATAFLIGSPGIGIDSLAISYILLGPLMAVVRGLGAVVTALATGLLVGAGSRARQSPPDPSPDNVGSDACAQCFLNPEVAMSTRSIGLDDELHPYLLDASLRESPLLAELRAETAALPEARMQIAPEQGQFMALLARLTGARRYLEIGTFTGYSSLVIAEALPADGRIVTCDLSREWTDIAGRYWRRAGVEDRIDLRLGPAADALQALREEDPAVEPFDLAFIDADKTGYREYYEHCLALLAPGGLVMIDNTLWHGTVADRSDQREDTVAIREFNRFVHRDERVDLSLVPIGDGLTLARKRAA